MTRKHIEERRTPLELAALVPAIGHNRVFYSREAGLVTPWYLTQRCEEERYRAERYGRLFRILLVEPAPGSNKAVVQGQVALWLQHGLRDSDIPAYLGGGRYAVLLPETDEDEAALFAARLRRDVQTVQVALSYYPKDGRTFADLLAAARGILRDRDLVA